MHVDICGGIFFIAVENTGILLTWEETGRKGKMSHAKDIAASYPSCGLSTLGPHVLAENMWTKTQ